MRLTGDVAPSTKNKKKNKKKKAGANKAEGNVDPIVTNGTKDVLDTETADVDADDTIAPIKRVGADPDMEWWPGITSSVVSSKFVALADILPPVPPKGEFDLQRIRDSLYFFS